MLKRINPKDVHLGMFVHKLEGSWFKHPFWKSKFLLTDPATLADLRDSDVDGVVINIAKGDDVAAPQARQGFGRSAAAMPAHPAAVRPGAARRPAPARPRAATTQPAIDPRSTARQPMAREFGVATAAASKSTKVINKLFLQSRLGKKINSSAVEPVIEDIFSSIQRNPHAFNGLMRWKRDNEYIYQHALAVSALMISLARQMRLTAEETRLAGMAGMLMDVGIGHLPIDFAEIGHDFRNLADDILRNHAQLGYDFLSMGGGIPEDVALVCLQHHERLDGSGYPGGLRGDAIKMLPRMAAICDIYDALVTDRADQRGMHPATALEQMSGMSSQLDGQIMSQFIQMMGVFPIGSVVRLRSDRLALVIDQDPDHASHPRVRTFFSIATGKLTAPEDIMLSQAFGVDEIVCIDDPESHGIQNFAKMRANIFAAASKANI